MALTRRKKRIKKERKNCNPEEKCLKCGESLKDDSHHFFCNSCYVPGIQYLPEFKEKVNLAKWKGSEECLKKK
jgi:hypothetical protein